MLFASDSERERLWPLGERARKARGLPLDFGVVFMRRATIDFRENSERSELCGALQRISSVGPFFYAFS